jgi:UDP-N-acetylmuramyl pentapeptide synthase
MKLNSVEEILEGLVYDSEELKTDLMVSSVEIDSRKVIEGGMFVALEGTKMDGHDFIHSAIRKVQK